MDWKHLKFKNKPWASLNLKKTVTPGLEAEGEVVDGEFVPRKVVAPRGHATQAERLFAKFGGAARFIAALERVGARRNKATIYKWTYPHPKGRGGRVPTTAWPDILLAARANGILLTPDDMRPDATTDLPRRRWGKRVVK